MAPPQVTIDFSWTPLGSAIAFTVGGHTYPYSTQADSVARGSDARYTAYTTPIGTTLTFTASFVPVTGVVPVEWRWDFGDGSIAYGPTATHKYIAAAPQIQTSLRMSDNFGRVSLRHKVMNLRALTPVSVQPMIRVVG